MPPLNGISVGIEAVVPDSHIDDEILEFELVLQVTAELTKASTGVLVVIGRCDWRDGRNEVSVAVKQD